MATRKHNDFLDVEQSDDDGSQGYDSENEDLRKGGRNLKRRKLERDASDDEEIQDSENELEEDETEQVKDGAGKEPSDVKPNSEKSHQVTELPGVSRPLTKKNLVATERAVKRSGVVYLSRIPPFMKPQKVRSLLEPYGQVNRIYLEQEDPASHTRRVRHGGNKKRMYTEGWVEFVNKADAKHVCELLNAKTIGGKKGGYYHDDVWNLKYLKSFKWMHLVQQIAEENAERASRLKAEISKTTKENKEFVQNVERAKMLEGMEAKKAERRRKEDEAATESTMKDEKPKKGGERPRHFKQTEVAKKKKPTDQPDQVKRVLSKIF